MPPGESPGALRGREGDSFAGRRGTRDGLVSSPSPAPFDALACLFHLRAVSSPLSRSVCETPALEEPPPAPPSRPPNRQPRRARGKSAAAAGKEEGALGDERLFASPLETPARPLRVPLVCPPTAMTSVLGTSRAPGGPSGQLKCKSKRRRRRRSKRKGKRAPWVPPAPALLAFGAAANESAPSVLFFVALACLCAEMPSGR